MKPAAARTEKRSAIGGFAWVVALAIALTAVAAPRAHADGKADARDQYERAVKMRTSLEGLLEKDRSADDYKKTVAAYRQVYLTTPATEDAAPALIAEGELYEEMGRLYDPKYFRTAIERFNFLLKQYPGSRYRIEALFTIGKIEEYQLNDPTDAEAAFNEFLQRFPHSDRAKEAQLELKGIAQQQAALQSAAIVSAAPAPAAEKRDANLEPELVGKSVEPRISDKRISSVMEIHTWNSNDSTRIIVSLNDTVKYDAVRIPDRIYFDLYRAKLGNKLEGKKLDLQNSVVTAVRVAQNKPDVVRVVLDVAKVKAYTAFLLADPYRLVIDIHDRGVDNAPFIAAALRPVGPVAPAATATPAASAEKTPASETTPSTDVNTNEVAMATPVKSDTSAKAASVSDQTLPSPPARPKSILSVDAETLRPLVKPKEVVALQPPPEPKPTRDGQRSLSRALGLKISRIVIDPGHGGHDTGTVGPHGLMEKDLCLDIALRLGRLIDQKLPGADVIYTRQDDTFIPLEERTAIANREKADLFISIHANSSQDESARGIETYYLNFATSAESMDVASRENATSSASMHDLQDLIQKIARNEKIEESKEFASDVQDSLTQRLQLVSHSEKNRGVKKAPFVVLIGADMPSILSEISFVSNPADEKLLRKTDQRQRIADGLYRGIASYLDSINSLSYDKQKLVSETRDDAAAVASGNPK